MLWPSRGGRLESCLGDGGNDPDCQDGDIRALGIAVLASSNTDVKPSLVHRRDTIQRS
jgi:hypothetical protein